VGTCENDFAAAARAGGIQFTRASAPWLTGRGHLDLPDEVIGATKSLHSICTALDGDLRALGSKVQAIAVGSRSRYSRERRLCRLPDCADLDTACVAQQEIPTRDIGTILFESLAALLRLGAIAGAGLARCYPILGDGSGVQRWHGRGSPSGLPCVSSHLNSRFLASVRTGAGAAPRIVPTSRDCKPWSAGASKNDIGTITRSA
jgi:hypothetical protein